MRYYFDPKLIADLARYRMRPYLAAVAAAMEKPMPTIDIQRLAQNIQRANTLTAKAASESDRGAKILDAFEQHLAGAGSHFDQIKAYDDQLVAMQQAMGNGGPPLDGPTFQPAPPPSPSAPAATSGSSFHHDTGDPVR
jgi:hypothetical protein